MNRFEYVTPKTIPEAVELLRGKGHVRAKAGGTDLVSLMKDRIIAPERLVNLQGLNLREITVNSSVRIGALATLDEVARHPELAKSCTALSVAAAESGPQQILNMGTVGGNLCQRSRCWYFRNDAFHCRKKGGFSCLARSGENRQHSIFANALCCSVHPSNLGTALVALDGSVEIVGSDGRRKVSAIELFDTGDDPMREHSLKKGEIISGIVLTPGWKSVYLEVLERQTSDWPLVSIARAEKNGVARTVFGGVAPRPWLVKEADVFSGIQTLSRNGYKKKLMETLFERARKSLR